MQIFFHIKLAVRSLRNNLKPALLICSFITTGLVALMMISGNLAGGSLPLQG